MLIPDSCCICSILLNTPSSWLSATMPTCSFSSCVGTSLHTPAMFLSPCSSLNTCSVMDDLSSLLVMSPSSKPHQYRCPVPTGQFGSHVLTKSPTTFFPSDLPCPRVLQVSVCHKICHLIRCPLGVLQVSICCKTCHLTLYTCSLVCFPCRKCCSLASFYSPACDHSTKTHIM